jgi:hypothetical protein
MPTVEQLDHPARLEEIARAIVAGEPVGAYDARDIRLAAAELGRLKEALRARGTPDRPAPDAPDDLAPTPPGAPPSVRAALAEARRVLDEDVSPGPWMPRFDPEGAGRTPDIDDADGGWLADVNWPPAPRSAEANARVLAQARRLLEHAIEAVEACPRCRYFAERKRDAPAVRCKTCRAFLAAIMAATGQDRGEG